MKEFLRGNDIKVKWSVGSSVKEGQLYVYGGTYRYEINCTLSAGVVSGMIAGDLLPTGFYSLEYVYSYTENEKQVYRRLKKGSCFAITEDEDDTEDNFTLAL